MVVYLVASVNYHVEYTSLDPVTENINPVVNVLLVFQDRSLSWW